MCVKYLFSKFAPLVRKSECAINYCTKYVGKCLWNVRICKPHVPSITSLDRKGLSYARCNSYRKTNSAKPALMLHIGAHYRARCIIGESHTLRVIQIERRPDRSTHALLISVHSGRTYGPVCIRAHVVSNRYRGYRQTGGEINTHRPAASATTTTTSARPRIKHVRILVYRIYFGASTSRPRICGDSISIALRGFRDASAYTKCPAAIDLFSRDRFSNGTGSTL